MVGVLAALVLTDFLPGLREVVEGNSDLLKEIPIFCRLGFRFSDIVFGRRRFSGSTRVDVLMAARSD